MPTSGAGPFGMAAGLDGNLWFAESFSDQIGRISPTGQVTEYAMPGSDSDPLNMSPGPDGNLWFGTRDGKIGKVTLTGKVTLFNVPGAAGGEITGISSGRDGNLWFTELDANNIGRITPSGTIAEFPVPTPNSQPTLITPGPDGNLWFTEYTANKIAKITPSGTITEFPALPNAGSGPTGITAGPDGNIWFTELDGDRIGRLTPAGTLTEFNVPTPNAGPGSISTGPDGNLWFTENTVGDIVARISPSGTITEFPVPVSSTTACAAEDIAQGPDGNMWFPVFCLGPPSVIARVHIASPRAHVLSLDAGFAPSTLTVPQATTVEWTFYGAQTTSVTDVSGMSLFDSGPKGPDSYFSFRFKAAGTYHYRDGVNLAHTGAVAVPMKVSPSSGGTSTAFTLTWASSSPPAGFVFDVQLFGPAQGCCWVNLLRGTTTTSTTFTPADGPGGYFFRARLRKTSDGTASKYSPVSSINVS